MSTSVATLPSQREWCVWNTKGRGWSVWRGKGCDTESRAAEIGSAEKILRQASNTQKFILPNPKRIAQIDERERDMGKIERGRIKEGTWERKWIKDRRWNREKGEDNKQEGEENKGWENNREVVNGNLRKSPRWRGSRDGEMVKGRGVRWGWGWRCLSWESLPRCGPRDFV